MEFVATNKAICGSILESVNEIPTQRHEINAKSLASYGGTGYTSPRNVMSTRPQYPVAWANYSPHQKLRWRQENMTNSTGFVGVVAENSGRFGAKIFDPNEGKMTWIGTFDAAEEASDAYQKRFIEIYGKEPEGEPDPDPGDLEGIREVLNMWPSTNDPLSPAYLEMFEREVRPLLQFDEEDTEEEP